MPRDLETEVKAKFKAPNIPSEDNYSPAELVVAKAEYKVARAAVLEKRNKWIAAEEVKEKAKEEERRKKDDEARRARAKKTASDAAKVLMEDPEACARCAEDSEFVGVSSFVSGWAG